MPVIEVVSVARVVARSALLRFALVGCVGFAVDAAAFKALALAGCPPLLGRIPSMLLGMTATFALNRGFTFGAGGALLPQALRYGAVNAAGATFNYAVFAVTLLATHAILPMAALVAGSLAGFSVNFLGAKHLAFRPPGRRPAHRGGAVA